MFVLLFALEILAICFFFPRYPYFIFGLFVYAVLFVRVAVPDT